MLNKVNHTYLYSKIKIFFQMFSCFFHIFASQNFLNHNYLHKKYKESINKILFFIIRADNIVRIKIKHMDMYYDNKYRKYNPQQRYNV